MTKTTRAILLASTAFGMMLASNAYAADADTMKTLQKQVNELQKQLNELQMQNKAKAEAPAAAEPARKEILPGVNVKLGGFFAMDGLYRDKNQVRDNLSTFAVPYDNSVNAHQSELRGTARATRLSLLAEGKAGENLSLAAYFETDFMGAGTTSNSVSSNSYVPRLRLAYATAERNDWGLRFLAGQAYSLTTLNKVGITPRTEYLPMVIDAALVPGILYTRNAMISVVKSFEDKKINVGLSVESPQVSTAGLTCTATAAGTCATFPNVNVTNTGGGTLNTTNYSTDYIPDFVGKIAFDPGWGHYELFGVARFFHDNVNYTDNNTAFAGGGGAAAYMPFFNNKIEVQVNINAGEGISRYSPVGFPDFGFNTDGTMDPLTHYGAMLGVVAHPTPTWDLYTYIGGEKVLRQEKAGSIYGYGDFDRSNAGCNTPGSTTCNGQTESVWMITPGFWHTMYKGDYGNVKVGAQYAYVRRDAFSDSAGNDPHASTNMVMTSFRYSPF